MPDPVDPARPSSKERRPPLAARLVALAMTLVLVGVGLLAASSGHFVGHTRLAGEVVLDGRPAVVMGFGLALLGLAPLGFWMPTARSAGGWTAITLVAGIAVMLASGRL
jgi:hypothetical protein